MSEKIKVPNGDYYIFADGSTWRMERWFGGRVVGGAREENMGSHRAAGDEYCACNPDLATEDVGVGVQRAILGIRRGSLEGFVVMREPD